MAKFSEEDEGDFDQQRKSTSQWSLLYLYNRKNGWFAHNYDETFTYHIQMLFSPERVLSPINSCTPKHIFHTFLPLLKTFIQLTFNRPYARILAIAIKLPKSIWRIIWLPMFPI